jgi:hypothetical protein
MSFGDYIFELLAGANKHNIDVASIAISFVFLLGVMGFGLLLIYDEYKKL